MGILTALFVVSFIVAVFIFRFTRKGKKIEKVTSIREAEAMMEKLGYEMSNIIRCTDSGTNGSGLKTIRVAGVERIEGRRIIDYSVNVGSKGKKGLGFFGLHLEESTSYSREWLVLCIYSAPDWLLLDGKWMDAHPDFHNIQEVVTDDRMEEIFMGAYVDEVQISDYRTVIKMESGGFTHILELTDDMKSLPPFATGEERIWYKKDFHPDAWVISRKADLVSMEF